MHVGVKICGITRAADGVDALAAGADALGVVLAAGSPRRVAEPAAASLLEEIRGAAPRPFRAVAVLDGLDAKAARHALHELGFDRVQLHGDGVALDLAACLADLGADAEHAWGVIRVRDADSLAGYGVLACEAYLLDAWSGEARGGTGTAFDWTLAAPFAEHRRIVVAGGLTAATVGDAIRALKPWMVDVSSGVEAGPGVKDPARVRAFVQAVRDATA